MTQTFCLVRNKNGHAFVHSAAPLIKYQLFVHSSGINYYSFTWIIVVHYIILYYICAYQSLPIPYFFIFYSAVLCCVRIRVRYILLYIIYSNKYVFCPLNDFHPILDFCVLFFFFVFSWRIIFNAVYCWNCVFLNLRLKAVNSPYYWHSIEAFPTKRLIGTSTEFEEFTA